MSWLQLLLMFVLLVLLQYFRIVMGCFRTISRDFASLPTHPPHPPTILKMIFPTPLKQRSSMSSKKPTNYFLICMKVLDLATQ